MNYQFITVDDAKIVSQSDCPKEGWLKIVQRPARKMWEEKDVKVTDVVPAIEPSMIKLDN